MDRSSTKNAVNGTDQDDRSYTQNGTKIEWNDLAEGPLSGMEWNDFKKVGTCSALVMGDDREEYRVFPEVEEEERAMVDEKRTKST